LTADLRAALASTLAGIRVQRRYPVQLVALFIWPVLLPTVYVLQARAFNGGSAAAAAAFAQRTGTTSIAGFLFVGFACYMWVSNVLWGPGTQLRQQQQQGQLEALFLTPASRLVILFGPSGSWLAISLSMLLGVGAVLRLFFGVVVSPAEALRAIVVVAVSVPAMVALGSAFSVAVLVFKEANGLVQGVRGTFQVFCGMTFPIVVLPGWAQQVALALPPTYFLRDVRATMLAGATLVQTAPDLLVLLGFAALLAAGGAAAFAAAEDFARRGGSLGTY
jgi:ABC-2 type transport system permease protein